MGTEFHTALVLLLLLRKNVCVLCVVRAECEQNGVEVAIKCMLCSSHFTYKTTHTTYIYTVLSVISKTKRAKYFQFSLGDWLQMLLITRAPISEVVEEEHINDSQFPLFCV